jgi:hypothetical protein
VEQAARHPGPWSARVIVNVKGISQQAKYRKIAAATQCQLAADSPTRQAEGASGALVKPLKFYSSRTSNVPDTVRQTHQEIER